MTHLTGHFCCASIKFPIEDETRSDPGTHSEKDHICATHAGTVSVFSNRPSVRIVLKQTWPIETLLENVFYGDIDPGRKVRRRLNHARDAIKWGAATHPHSNRFPRTVTLQCKHDQFFDFRESLFRSEFRQSRNLFPKQNAAGMFGEDPRRLCPANINAHQHRSSSYLAAQIQELQLRTPCWA